MRLFISLQFTDEFKKTFLDLSDYLKKNEIGGRFTKAENLHLTLAFIGDYPEPRDILEIIDESDFKGTEISLKGWGTFGDLLWIGLDKNEYLDRYVKRLRHMLAENSIPFDKKPFRSHITLIRDMFTSKNGMPEIIIPDTKLYIENVSLMRSERGKKGMNYTEIT